MNIRQRWAYFPELLPTETLLHPTLYWFSINDLYDITSFFLSVYPLINPLYLPQLPRLLYLDVYRIIKLVYFDIHHLCLLYIYTYICISESRGEKPLGNKQTYLHFFPIFHILVSNFFIFTGHNKYTLECTKITNSDQNNPKS